MYFLLYILFSVLDSSTIQLENKATIVLAEPMNWSVGDELEIHLNHNWFSSYTYLLINKTDSSACCAIIPAQKIFTEQAYLWGIDGVVRVREDIYDMRKSGSYWHVKSLPWHWNASEPLLIGYSGSSAYPNLLINLAQNSYLQARFIQYFNLFDDC